MRNIAIVEDQDNAAQRLAGYIDKYAAETGQEFRVTRFCNGEEFLKDYKCVFAVVFMDIQMPNMDGYQAAKIIRDLSGNYRTIPIIAMTANAFDEDRQKALSVGMDAHLAKPVDVKRLFGILRNVIR